MPPAPVILILVLAAMLVSAAKPVGHVLKKTGHGIVHVVTLGKK